MAKTADFLAVQTTTIGTLFGTLCKQGKTENLIAKEVGLKRPLFSQSSVSSQVK